MTIRTSYRLAKRLEELRDSALDAGVPDFPDACQQSAFALRLTYDLGSELHPRYRASVAELLATYREIVMPNRIGL